MEINIRGKHFANQKVLEDIHIHLKVGEVIAILGPSGAGKSTLLQILSGLDTHFDGNISQAANTVGYCFQEPRLLPWLSVHDNLQLVAGNTRQDIHKMLNAVGLAEQANTYCSKLSLGMSRRVALARALIINPDLLLLDEPLASLDKQRAQKLLNLIIDLVRGGTTATILVTHEPLEAAALSDRIMVLSHSPATIVQDLKVDLTEQQRRDPQAIKSWSEDNLFNVY